MILQKLKLFSGTKESFLFLFFLFLGFVVKSQNQSDFYITDGRGDQNILVDCSYPLGVNNCLLLSAHYPTYKATNQYSVSATAYRPYPTTNKTTIKGNLDDIFTEAINLPFTFCFYGDAYNKIIIGSNGMVSFDVAQANQPNAPNFTESLPSANLPKKSIFGVLHDMYFYNGTDSEISYSVIGSAPYRKFVINFYKGLLYGCDQLFSTSQIVLSEGSNTIEVFVEKKEETCSLAGFKNAIIGINDATGTKGIAAPGRNTGVWAAQNEAWLFAPDGNNLTPGFIWRDASGNVIGNQKDQLVCPQKEAVYSLDIVYNTCEGNSQVYKDDITVKFSADFPTVQPYNKIICNTNEDLLLKDFKSFLCTNTNLADFSFEFRDALTGQLVDENTPFRISSNKSYNVTILNKNSPTCKANTTLSLQLIFGNINVTPLFLCDMLNDEVEANYNVKQFNDQIVGSSFSGSIGYFLSYNNANNNTGEVTTYDVKKDTEFFVRLSLQGCVNVLGPFTIRFNKTPVVNSPVEVNVDICDINGDGNEAVDWEALLGTQITTDPSVTKIRVFNTYDEAFQALPYMVGVKTVKNGNYKVYARVENSEGCFSIVEMSLKVLLKAIVLRDISVYLCFDGIQDVPVDLGVLSNGMLVSAPSGTVVGPIFFSSYFGAITNDPSRVITANQLITDNGANVSKTYFVRYQIGADCYSVKPLTVFLTHLEKNITQFNICDAFNDGTENISLANFTNSIVHNGGAQVLFFSSQQAAVDNVFSTILYNATVNGTLTLYARALLNGCVEIYPVTFSLINTPNIKNELVVSLTNICDNNADGKENIDLTQYESQINFNNENVRFEYYQNYNPSNQFFSNAYGNPNNVSFSDGTVVYVKVINNNSGCFSVSKLTLKVTFYPPILLTKTAVLKTCDKELNFGETFDLSSALSQVFDARINTSPIGDFLISYYANEMDANSGQAASQISSIYRALSGNVFVYVRFQSKINGCYSVAPINLLSYFPVKAKNTIIKICDNNLDGFYDVNLMAYKDQMVQFPNAENQFTFYRNLSDVDVPGKAISDPTNYVLNPYTSQIWVKVETLRDCGSIAQIDFTKGTQLTLIQKQFNITICDEKNDGKEILNLTQFENTFGAGFSYEYFQTLEGMNLQQDKIQTPSAYSFELAKGITRLYVKVSKPGFCPDFFTIDVVLNTTPMMSIADAYYCKNDLIGIDIRPNFTGLNVVYYQWEFPDGRILAGPTQDYLSGIKTVGNYKVTLTNSLACSYTVLFKVINVDTPEIVSLRGENDYYIVEASGLPGRKIVYSMDLIHWQDSPKFGNLKQGDYTFYVKYFDSDCYGDPRRGKIFTVNNSITPNGDGINDFWKLSGLGVFAEPSSLRIFDKYGTIVYQQVSNTEFTWNGKLSDRNLPSDAYWYVIIAADGRTYKGWILLKNRN